MNQSPNQIRKFQIKIKILNSSARNARSQPVNKTHSKVYEFRKTNGLEKKKEQSPSTLQVEVPHKSTIQGIANLLQVRVIYLQLKCFKGKTTKLAVCVLSLECTLRQLCQIDLTLQNHLHLTVLQLATRYKIPTLIISKQRKLMK